MKCPKCQSDNRSDVTFCEECGELLGLECPNCGNKVPVGKNFCGICGQKLEEAVETSEAFLKTEGERKQVTVLFSDLTGYTAMSEKLDPEDLREIISRIFREITEVIRSYDGFVEKYIGDAAMALFGVPKTHEDDPIRAIRAAQKIHEIVPRISPELEKVTGRTVSMHSGISTGLVVTGELNAQKGTHGVSGEPIIIASRLSDLAKPNEILTEYDTCRSAEGHFVFEKLDSTVDTGKTDPVRVCRVLSEKERPANVHRLSGLRADLIGRENELRQLIETIERLLTGEGTIFSIWGDAGTGKVV